MSATVLSPNMNITVPGPGQETGPQWATDLYNALYSVIDLHDHSTGKGVAITSGSININADLPMGNNSLTGIFSLKLTQQSNKTNVPAATYASALYSAPNGGSGGYDLYYNDGAGNQIPITQSGSVLVTAGNISGLSSPAAVTFSSPTFKFYSDTTGAGTLANVNVRNLALTNNSAGSNTYSLTPPAGMASNYTCTFPVPPASTTSIMQMTSAGTITAGLAVDGTTLSNSGSVLSITSLGVNTAQLAAGAVTKAKLAALGQQISSDISFTTSSATAVAVTGSPTSLTTTGRPVYVGMLPYSDGTTSSGIFGAGTSVNTTVYIYRDSTPIGSWNFPLGSGGTNMGTSIYTVDTPSAGTYSYSFKIKLNGGTSITMSGRLICYEID